MTAPLTVTYANSGAVCITDRTSFRVFSEAELWKLLLQAAPTFAELVEAAITSNRRSAIAED